MRSRINFEFFLNSSEKINTTTKKMALRHDTKNELEQKLLEPLEKLDDLVIRREFR